MNVLDFLEQVKVRAGDNNSVKFDLDFAIEMAEKRLKPADFQEFMEAELVETEVVSVAEWVQYYYTNRLAGISGEELYNRTLQDSRDLRQALYETARQAGIEVAKTDVLLAVSASDALTFASG